MYPPPTVTLPQDQDLSARRELLPGGAALVYVSARARDTLAANAPNQDFVAFRYDSDKIVFAVCDGVSQSFYGDLAARLLGTRLVSWLWACDLDGQSTTSFLAELNAALRHWTADATARVQAKAIRADLPEMQRVALERKRLNGSESMFVAGLIDRTHDRIVLCWLGDSRLRLWTEQGQPIELPNVGWETRQRWSSRIGPKNGEAYGCILSLDSADAADAADLANSTGSGRAIARITAHTDGVGRYAGSFAQLAPDQLDPMIEVLRQGPTSDDVSVLDINLHVPAEYGGWQILEPPKFRSQSLLSDAGDLLTWDAVPFAAGYRLAIDDGDLPFSRELAADVRTYALPRSPDSAGVSDQSSQTLTFSIQALNDYTLPSPWSTPLTLSVSTARPDTSLTAEVVPAPLPGESVVQAEAHPTRPRRPGPSTRKRSVRRQRLRAFLILLISAVLMIGITSAAWLFQQSAWTWINGVLDAVRRM